MPILVFLGGLEDNLLDHGLSISTENSGFSFGPKHSGFRCSVLVSRVHHPKDEFQSNQVKKIYTSEIPG